MQTNSRMKAVAKKSNRISVFIIVAVSLVLGTVLMIGRSDLHAKNVEYQQQEQQIRDKIEQQELRTDELKEYEKYVKSDEFTEKTAREMFGLVGEDEYAIKADQ